MGDLKVSIEEMRDGVGRVGCRSMIEAILGERVRCWDVASFGAPASDGMWPL